MDIDIERYFGPVTREVLTRDHEGRPARVVRLSRDYPTDIDDLWDALTNQQRIPRWFSPVSGDLQLGGRYQVEGNAGGTITACEPPQHFAATWEFFGAVSWVAVTLAPAGDASAHLTLEHMAYADEHWDNFGPGAVGVGWDLAQLGMALYLESGEAVDAAEVEAWCVSDQGKAFITACSEDWGRAAIADGAPREIAEAAAARTTAFYTGAAPMEEPGS